MTKAVQKEDSFDAYGFAVAMEKAMAGDQSPQFKTKKSFSPSVIGYGHGTCPRYWHIAFSGATFDDSADAQGVANMNNGSFVHDRLQEQIRKALGEDVIIEKELVLENPPVRGFIDVIAEFGGKTAVGEIKSAKQEIFDKIVMENRPLAYHLVQILIYMRSQGIKHGFFYYENKNTQQFIIIPVTMDDRLENYVEYLFDWMQKVYDAFKDGKTAKPLSPKRTVKECRYCPVKAECLSRLEGDSELPVLKLPT